LKRSFSSVYFDTGDRLAFLGPLVALPTCVIGAISSLGLWIGLLVGFMLGGIVSSASALLIRVAWLPMLVGSACLFAKLYQNAG
jgi:hypothetical protein